MGFEERPWEGESPAEPLKETGQSLLPRRQRLLALPQQATTKREQALTKTLYRSSNKRPSCDPSPDDLGL